MNAQALDFRLRHSCRIIIYRFASDGYRHDAIFLSQAREADKTFVRRRYADLTKPRFDLWYDRVSIPAQRLTFHQETQRLPATCRWCA